MLDEQQMSLDSEDTVFAGLSFVLDQPTLNDAGFDATVDFLWQRKHLDTDHT
jgi:hypothetical protein